MVSVDQHGCAGAGVDLADAGTDYDDILAGQLSGYEGESCVLLFHRICKVRL